MQEKWFLLCLRNSCENTFLKLQIFVFLDKKNVKTMLGYWPYAWKQNIFSFLYFFWCLDENRVFSYRICILYSTKIQTCRKSQIFEYIFEENFWMGHTRPKRKMGRHRPNSMGLLSTGLDSAQQHGLGWGSSPKQVWTGYCAYAQ